MVLRLHQKFIAGVVAAAVVVTVIGSGQAKAQENYRTERTLATILGLAVVGAIISKELEDRDDRRRARDQNVRRPEYRHRNNGYMDGRAPAARHKPKTHAHRKYALPERCLRRVRTGRGDAVVYGKRCMQRHYRHAHRLPHWCERRFRTDRGTRFGWSASCLRQEGFYTARR